MSKLTTNMLLALLSLSGLLNVVLGFKIVSLRRNQGPVPKIKVGTRLETLVGTDPDGGATTVSFGASKAPTVLLILRPGCHWCELNMPNWQTLIRAKSTNFRFVAVSLSTLDFKRSIEGSGLAVPAVFPVAGKNPTLGTLTGTPQTIVVGQDGIVRKVWFGAYTPDIKRDVESYFDVSLPVSVE